MQPADLARIVHRALARCEEADPLCVRAHADDCAELAAAGYPARADAALRRGDVVIEVRSGTIDASLGARIESLLAAR
jgi:flagellar biosynthesis/type III secretory pathway protein FliH